MNESFLFYVVAFLLVCLVASFVMNGIRLSAPRQLLSESLRLFVTISVGIAVFSVVVWVLECILIRPLV